MNADAECATWQAWWNRCSLRDGTTPKIKTTAMSMAVAGGVKQILLNWVHGVIQSSREDVVQQSRYFFEAIAEFGAGTPRT
ncbi:hypothetical protein [Streptomyces sp. NPDC004008]